MERGGEERERGKGRVRETTCQLLPPLASASNTTLVSSMAGGVVDSEKLSSYQDDVDHVDVDVDVVV